MLFDIDGGRPGAKPAISGSGACVALGCVFRSTLSARVSDADGWLRVRTKGAVIDASDGVATLGGIRDGFSSTFLFFLVVLFLAGKPM